MRKIPTDAFELYATTRSYQAVASKYNVSVRAVTKCAKREDWQGKLAAAEREARERAVKKLTETIEAMTDRHLRALKIVQGKALEALRSMPIATAMDAVRALDMAMKMERLIRGEPGERTVFGTGVLVVPAEMTPSEWVAQQMEKNKERSNPVGVGNAGTESRVPT